MRIDAAAVDAAAAERGFSGIVTLDAGDERLLERTFGYAHRALASPNTTATRFATASGGKSFTALAVMRLIESGALTLETPVRSILGTDLPLIDDAVTIEHLLAHTSGIGDYLDEDDWEPEDHVLPVPVHTLDTAEAFVPVIDGYPQVFAPGADWAYNNGGYIVLAIVIERVSGRGYHEFVENEVCAPARLTATGFLRSDDLPGDAALGYLAAEGNRTNVLHLPVRGNGDGGIFTTADDLHRFWTALHAGGIVSTEHVAELTRPRHGTDQDLRYGMGFWLHATQPIVVMDGYDAGVSFRSLHDPRSGATVSMLSNSSVGAGPMLPVLEDLLTG